MSSQRPSQALSLLIAIAVASSSLACAPALADAPPASASIAVKSPAEIHGSAAASGTPEEQRKYFETARLYAAYKCAGAEAKLTRKMAVQESSSSSSMTTAGIVIGALGVVGGVATALLANRITPEAPSAPSPGAPPTGEVDVKGKSTTVWVGVGGAVAVTGAVLVTLLVVGKRSDDDEGSKAKKSTDALVVSIDGFKKDCENPPDDRLKTCIDTAGKLAADCEARLK